MIRFLHHCTYGDTVEIYINDHEDVVVTISHGGEGFTSLLTRKDAQAVVEGLRVVIEEEP
jgi:hypothetical protein